MSSPGGDLCPEAVSRLKVPPPKPKARPASVYARGPPSRPPTRPPPARAPPARKPPSLPGQLVGKSQPPAATPPPPTAAPPALPHPAAAAPDHSSAPPPSRAAPVPPAPVPPAPRFRAEMPPLLQPGERAPSPPPLRIPAAEPPSFSEPRPSTDGGPRPQPPTPQGRADAPIPAARGEIGVAKLEEELPPVPKGPWAVLDDISLAEIQERLMSDSDDEDLPPLPSDSEGTEAKPQDKCRMVASEIVSTERSYVDSLRLIQDVFAAELEACAKPVLPEDKRGTIFSNSASLLQVHVGVLSQLETVIADMDGVDTGPGIGQTMHEVAPHLKPYYYQYTSNFDKAMAALDECTKKYPEFDKLLRKCNTDPRCGPLGLSAYMLEPIQRIPRYKLLLQEYLKKLNPEHRDYKLAEAALIKITEVAAYVNAKMAEGEKIERMMELQKLLPPDFKFQAVTPGRMLVREGELAKMCRKGLQQRIVVLFTDCLLYCHEEYRRPTKINLDKMQIVAFDGAAVGVEHSITITQKKKSFMLGCASAQEREAWLADLNAVIQQHKSKQKSFRKASVGEDDSEEPENKLGYGYEAPVWIPDSGVSMCQTCASGFSILRRRHHCRLCGKVCCGPCSGYQLPIGYDGGANGRVCVECFAEYGDDKNEDVKKKLLQIREKMSEKSALKQAAKGFQRDRGAMMAGYLSVRQGKKTYKRFWYVLMQDFCLYQYRRPEDVVAVSSLPLPGYAVQMHPKGTLGVDRDYVLAVCHPSLKPAYFDTESEAFCEEWLKVLSSATRAELPPGMTKNVSVDGDSATEAYQDGTRTDSSGTARLSEDQSDDSVLTAGNVEPSGPRPARRPTSTLPVDSERRRVSEEQPSEDPSPKARPR